MSSNYVTIVGRLGADPELKFLPNTGNAATEFGLAFQRGKRGPDGKWENGETDWFRVKCFEKAAEAVAKLPKGALVRVSGRLVQERWEQDGEPRQTVKIIANNIDVATVALTDIESSTGRVTMTWGSGEQRRPAPTNNGFEDRMYDEERWGEGPGF